MTRDYKYYFVICFYGWEFKFAKAILGGALTGTDENRNLTLYRTLYRLNRAFVRIDNDLRQLIAGKTFHSEYAEVWQDRLGEMQAEINRRLTGTLNEQETAQVRRLGPVNERREEAGRVKKTRNG